MLRYGIHAGAHHRNVQLDSLGQHCGQVHLIRNHFRIGRYQKDIVKCNALANNFTHFILSSLVKYKIILLLITYLNENKRACQYDSVEF